MKTSIKTLIVSFLVSGVALAQTKDATTKQTLLSGKIKKVGIIGTLAGQYTTLNGSALPSAGGSVSLLFNEKFAVGVAGYGIQNPNATTGTVTTRGGVGGLQFEYILNPNKLVHVSFPLLIGGGVAATDTVGNKDNYFWGRGGRSRGYSFGFRNGQNTTFAVVQPGINVELNVLKFLSLYAGANYRMALNSSSTTLTNSKLSGASFQLGLRAGFSSLSIPKFGRRKR